MSEEDEDHDANLNAIDPVTRDSVCFAQPRPYVETLPGTKGFQATLSRLYAPHENRALTELVKLKNQLRNATSEEFWMSITEGLARLTGAQVALVSRRILYDEHKLAVEMPPLGEPGSCLMASSIFFEDEAGHGETKRNWKHEAFQCPCAAMRHDKVFLIPERFGEYVTNSPNKLPQPMESYIGLPLFADGKCFAHFGVMWSPKASANRNLSWGFIETMLHSVEDMILQRLLDGDTFLKHLPELPNGLERNRVIPHEVVSAGQSLKPYARSLSHELRTPMQGVVGMLDMMYATLQEASEDQTDPRVRKVFEQLKNNIEMVQGKFYFQLERHASKTNLPTDSSRRAVEAADNVVHAYDMNMGLPEGPENDTTLRGLFREDLVESPVQGKRPDIVIPGSNLPIGKRGIKRRRESTNWNEGTLPKIRKTEAASQSSSHKRTPPVVNEVLTQSSAKFYTEIAALEDDIDSADFDLDRVIAPGLRHTSLSDVLQYVVNDSLKVGGRPETTVAHQTENGEVIEVTSIGPDMTETIKIVEWSVDPMVPESILGKSPLLPVIPTKLTIEHSG